MCFGEKDKNKVTLPHIAQRKHELLGKTKQMSKSKKISPRKKVYLEQVLNRIYSINPVGLLSTVTEISTRNFVIIRHTCHRCIYILVAVIITVATLFVWCRITTFTETDLFLPFLIIFRWILTFCN